MKAAPIVHVELRGLDEPLLRDFYRDVFGWNPSEQLSIDEYSIAEIGGGAITAATGRVPDWHARECVF